MKSKKYQNSDLDALPVKLKYFLKQIDIAVPKSMCANYKKSITNAITIRTQPAKK